MNFKTMILVSALALSTVAQANERGGRFRSPYPRGAISEFSRLEREVIYWNDKFQRAPSGSYEERRADDQRRAAGRDALDSIQRRDAFRGYDSEDIADFADDLDEKFQRASVRSYMETFYGEARSAVWDALKENAEWDVRSGRAEDWSLMLKKAEDYDAKYQRAPSRSAAEAAYDSLRQTYYKGASDLLPEYVNAGRFRQRDFAHIDHIAADLYNKYRHASARSLAESTYGQMAQTAFDGAVSRLEDEARYMST